MTGLWWDVEGDGPGAPMLLLPEASRPAVAWPPALVEALVEAGHPVVRLDLRDQGRSPWGGEPFELDDLVGDVAEVLDVVGERHGPRPVQLVGWGLGGAVALDLVLRRPTAFTGLTLLGTSGWVVDPTLPGPDEPTAVALVWRARGGTEAEILARALGRERRALCGPGERPDAAAALEEASRWVAWGFNPHDRQRAAWLGAGPRWAAAAALAGAHGAVGPGPQVVVVHGSEDPLVPVAHGRRLAAVTGGRLVELPGAGHELTPLVADALRTVLLGAPN